MGLSINTNISAMIALQNLDQTQTQLDSSVERLSTGLRINSGADDPSGLIVSQGMQSEIQGINQAIQNTQDATNMAKTADGALSEISSLLLTLRGLAVNAANSGVLDSAALQADQTQVQAILQSINSIASDTQFDNKKLLDGSAGTIASVTNASEIGGIYMGGKFGSSILEGGPITATKVQAATEALVTLSNSFASSNAAVTTSGTIVINGYTITTNGTDTLQSLVNKINAASNQTGVSAAITGSGPVQVVLSQSNFGSQYSIDVVDSSGILSNKPTVSDSGTDAVFKISATTSSGLQTVTFTGGVASGNTGLQLTDNNGNSILLTQSGNAAITTVPVQIGQVSSGGVQFQVGPDAGQVANFALPAMFTQDLGNGVIPNQSLANIDLTTTVGANNAMQVVSAAVQQVATVRGQLGAFQADVLQSVQNYLQTANQNLVASNSNITDTDMASEMTTFTKLQILQQSGVAVLAQANAMPKSVLTLIQNG